jgi:hypothetical protein
MKDIVTHWSKQRYSEQQPQLCSIIQDQEVCVKAILEWLAAGSSHGVTSDFVWVNHPT